jgi:hypothetical protein
LLLFLQLEHQKDGVENESKLEIYDFLQQNNPNNADEFDFYGEPNPEDLRKKIKIEDKKYQTKKIGHFNTSHEKTASIKIATPSKNYQKRNEKVRMGIFTHEILSKINSTKNIHSVIESYVLNGTIDLNQKAEIENNIHLIIEKYPQYFGENLEIINEKDIMISNNGISEMYRPDRLIKSENGYFIIDFKTGEADKKHLSQVETYEKVLQSLGKKVSGKEVVYI